MYKTTTSFIKAQNPGITSERLLEYYKQELEFQRVNRIEIDGSRIFFRNNRFKLINRYPNKFAGFLGGEIEIQETDAEFLVCLRADISGLIEMAGALGLFSFVLFLLVGGISLLPLVICGLLFLLILTISYFSLFLFFPVYFASVRINIERLFQHSPQS